MSRRMFRGESPLGKQIRPGRVGLWLSIVGVAGNVKSNGLVERDDPEYSTVRKHSPQDLGRSSIAIIRSTVDARATAGLVRAEVAALDPMLPVTIEPITTAGRKAGATAALQRSSAGPVRGNGAVALGHRPGLVSFFMAQSTQEIGVRMALGATPGEVARLVLGVQPAGHLPEPPSA